MRAFDTDGNVLPARFAGLIDLQLINPSGATVTDCSLDSDGWSSSGVANFNFLESHSGIAQFHVCGTGIGPSQLRVKASLMGAEDDILSNVVSINVSFIDLPI